MDPNLFHLDYERLFEALITIVVFAFFVERALSVIFETKWFINMYEADEKRKGIKEIITLVVAIAVCVFWRLDALSIIVVSHSNMQVPGYIMTGAIIAGGSKGSIRFFKDVLGFMSTAEKERLKIREINIEKVIKNGKKKP
jgi:hypothetical protein